MMPLHDVAHFGLNSSTARRIPGLAGYHAEKVRPHQVESQLGRIEATLPLNRGQPTLPARAPCSPVRVERERVAFRVGHCLQPELLHPACPEPSRISNYRRPVPHRTLSLSPSTLSAVPVGFPASSTASAIAWMPIPSPPVRPLTATPGWHKRLPRFPLHLRVAQADP
jgi:hypothetical protein